MGLGELSPNTGRGASVTMPWVDFDTLTELLHHERIPARGGATRPERDGQTWVYDDGQRVGTLERIEWFRDLTRDLPEVVRVQYQPQRFAKDGEPAPRVPRPRAG